jgi:hypothetical protein
MKFVTISLLSWFIFVAPVRAVVGRVLEAANLEPVPGATVTLVGTTITATTDSAGLFQINPAIFLLPGGLQSATHPFLRGGLIYIMLAKKSEVEAEWLDVQGKRAGATGNLILETGSHALDMKRPVSAKPYPGVVLLRLRVDGKSSLYRIFYFSCEGETLMAINRVSLSELAKHSRTAASGEILIHMEKLLDTTVDYQDASDNLGDIVLQYPPRVMGVGAPPIYGARILFNGSTDATAAYEEMQTNWEHWMSSYRINEGRPKEPVEWEIVPDPKDAGWWNMQTKLDETEATDKGYVRWNWADIVAKPEFAFRDYQLHVEFNMNGDNGDTTAYCNAGVYIKAFYEIQIESWWVYKDTVAEDIHTGSGNIIDWAIPIQNANRDQGKWQAYDVVFRNARYSEDGSSLLETSCITVYWNQKIIHDNVELAPSDPLRDTEIFPVRLQSEGYDIRFRNIWVKPLSITERQTNIGY